MLLSFIEMGSHGGGGGGGGQIPRRGLTENFNMTKINNLTIPWGGGGSGPPVPPTMDPPMLWLHIQYLYCYNLNILSHATKDTRQSFDVTEVKIELYWLCQIHIIINKA